MSESHPDKQNLFNHLGSNKSDLIAQSRPFEDLSNLNHNHSSISLKQNKPSSKRVSETSNFQPNTIRQEQPFICLKFRIALNEFNEDYYIFNLELKPQLHLDTLAHYFLQYPALSKIIEKSKNRQSKILGIKSSQKLEFAGNFSLANQKLSNCTTVKQIVQIFEKSNKKQNFIDFSFDWTRKKIQKDHTDIKKSKPQTSEQSCCALM